MPYMIGEIYKSDLSNLICPYTPEGNTTENETLKQWEIAFVPKSGDPTYRNNFFKGYRGVIAFDSGPTELEDCDVEIYFRGTLRSALYTPDLYPVNPFSNAAWPGILGDEAREAWHKQANKVWAEELGYELFIVTADDAIEEIEEPAFVKSDLVYTINGYLSIEFYMWDIVNNDVPVTGENFTLHYGPTEECEYTRNFDLTDMDETGLFELHGLVYLTGLVYSYVTVGDFFRSGLHLYDVPEP